MGWVLICALIAVVGLAYLVLQAREVWRKVRALLGELEAAAARVDQLTQPTQGSPSPTGTGPVAGSQNRSGT